MMPNPDHQPVQATEAPPRPELVDACIAWVDSLLSSQMNAILHHPRFQQLEAAWRSLKFLVERTDFRQNIRIHILSVSKEDLRNDFEDSPEIIKSGLYHHVYTAEYGQFGGKPYGAIIGNYDFGPHSQDIRLLQQIGTVAMLSHAPFLTAVDKSFFGITDWEMLPSLKDIHAILEMPQYSRWHSFRASDEARYVVMTLPGFLLRTPYNPSTNPVLRFRFKEKTFTTDEYCWGNTAFAFATCLAGSFAEYRWCVNIVGPEGGGAVKGLPVCHFEATGRMQSRIPTRALISENREFELAEEGFVSLSLRKGTEDTVFFSANSTQKPRKYAQTPDGLEAEMNFKLSTQLPYMMIMNRLAHYIKTIQRENIGVWKERLDLENELNKWISDYVTQMDNPDITTRSKRPLRLAQIAVGDVPGNPGWYAVTLKAKPHFKYMGANVTLSLVGKLERE